MRVTKGNIKRGKAPREPRDAKKQVLGLIQETRGWREKREKGREGISFQVSRVINAESLVGNRFGPELAGGEFISSVRTEFR